MRKQTKRIISIMIIFTLFIGLLIQGTKVNAVEENCEVNLTNLTYTINGETSNIKKYTQDEFNEFVTAFNEKSLPIIFIPEFLPAG